MLTLRCASCKKKLWRYNKIGHGEVLRCHKERITKEFDNYTTKGHKIYCVCGKEVGIDKGLFYKMIAKSFTYAGTKLNK